MGTLNHKAGFVTLVGKPNAGKSTLMNTLVGEELSITTAKAQTTRHQVAGILNGENFQIIYTDTPGVITPHNALQQCMTRTTRRALDGTDLLLWVIDVQDQAPVNVLSEQLQQKVFPVLWLINKIDLVDRCTLQDKMQHFSRHVPKGTMIPISALHAHNTTLVLERILTHLPEHPPYYPKDALTDKPKRFFVAEIIREKILRNYYQEIPYSVEVVVENFKEEVQLVKLSTLIYVEKYSQKYILIGKKGSALKKTGTEARHSLEKFLGKRVFLEQCVKVLPKWRTQLKLLRQFGYA